MQLRSGITVQHALQVLDNQVCTAGNVRNIMHTQVLAQYIAWADETDRMLRNLFLDQELLNKLHTPAYWHFRGRGANEIILRGPGGVHNLIESQQEQLLAAMETLRSFLPLAGRPGDVFMLDTNSLLQFRRFDEITWRDELGSKKIRLAIPLVVLDEVDEKIYASSKQLAGRADSVLRALDRHIDKAVDDTSVVRDGVTLEILPDPVGHRRNTDKDHEILNRADFMSQVIERPVTVVSNDRGMRVRGRGRKITVRPLSDKWRLPLSKEG